MPSIEMIVDKKNRELEKLEDEFYPSKYPESDNGKLPPRLVLAGMLFQGMYKPGEKPIDIIMLAMSGADAALRIHYNGIEQHRSVEKKIKILKDELKIINPIKPQQCDKCGCKELHYNEQNEEPWYGCSDCTWTDRKKGIKRSYKF